MDGRPILGPGVETVAAGSPAIPTLLHYTWRTAEVPARFEPFVRSWHRHHPGWTHRLWTDADLRCFVAEHDPEFLPVLDGYPEPIMRVDAARYLVMAHLGGVFVDLDLECFRPVDPLLEGHSLVIGLEPESHVQTGKAAARKLDRLPCPSFLASAPHHPFWTDVRRGLMEARHEIDPLDATGPFLLSRLHARYRHAAPVRLVEPALLYPVDRDACWRGEMFDIERWDRIASQAYAHHHWEGTWFRNRHPHRIGAPAGAVAQISTGRHRIAPPVRLKLAPNWSGEGRDLELVSCVMVTGRRAPLAKLAIQCFRNQTWPARELVIIDDDPDDALARHVDALGDPAIRHIRVPAEGRPLGALRNQSLAHARGALVCQWDDDDLYDPLRIELQMRVMGITDSAACFLPRWLQWLPGLGMLAVSSRRVWEGSMLCRKEILPPYPEIRRGEDTPVAMAIVAGAQVVHLDLPRLYLYVGHERNTHAPAHHRHLMNVATARFMGPRADAVLRELDRRLPTRAYRAALDQLKADPRPLPAARPLGELRRAVGVALAERRFADVLQIWDEMLRHGDLPEALIGRAEALALLRRHDDAARAFAQFASRFQHLPQGPCGMARVAMRQRNFTAAAAACREALRRAPDDAASLCEMGRLLLLQELGDEAARHFRRAAAIAPGHRAPLMGLAGVATQQQDWPDATRRWREIWDRFRDRLAPMQIVTALAFQDRGDEARAFLANLSAPGWTPADQLAAQCRLARLQHDWDWMAGLLDRSRDIATGDPRLRRHYMEALLLRGRFQEAVALVHRFGVGTAATDQAVSTRALIGAGLVDVAYQHLRKLASSSEVLRTPARLLPDILAALRASPGPAEARRVLERIAASPDTAKNLRLAAIFERNLDDSLAALSGAGALPAGSSATATGIRAVLAAPDDPADRSAGIELPRALRAIAAIHGRHPGSLLDTQTNLAAALALGDRVARAVAEGAPLSIIRLGDGEGNFLPYAGDLERHRRTDQASIQRIWWAHEPLPPAGLRRIELELAAAIRMADIVGIPDAYRLVLSLGGGTMPTQTSRGVLAVVEQFAGVAPAPEGGPIGQPHHLLTSCHLNNAFAFWRIWDALLGRLGRCAVITGRNDLPAALERRFGVAVTRVFAIPPERKFVAPSGTPTHHFDGRFDELRGELASIRPGEAILVAAGILGKIYCAAIRQAGGIAIDIGSAADHWCGQETRTGNEAAAFRPPPRLGEWYAGRADLDAAYPALRPSAWFRERGPVAA